MQDTYPRLKLYCKRNPKFAKLLRDNPCKKTGYQQLDFVISSQPTNPKEYIIIGLFYIDTCAVKKHSKEIIVQDFVARDTTKNLFVRYSGEGKHNCKGNSQCIKCFCNKFGKFNNGTWGQYGCSEKKTTNHRYDINSPKLPKEKEVKEIIKRILNEIKPPLDKTTLKIYKL